MIPRPARRPAVQGPIAAPQLQLDRMKVALVTTGR